MCTVVAAYWAMAAMTAASAYSSTQTQKSNAEYQQSVAENNQKVAQWQAADAAARGNTEAANVRRKYAAMQGTQRAALAARGLDIADGTASSILNDTSYFGKVDEATVRANAAREAWGYQVRATNFGSDAAAYGAAADAANPLLAAGMAAGRSLLGSYAGGSMGVADKWNAYTGANDFNGVSGSNALDMWGRYGSGGD